MAATLTLLQKQRQGEHHEDKVISSTHLDSDMTTQDTNGGPRLELLASTSNIANITKRRIKSAEDVPPYIENAQWTADGTTILTYSSNNQIAGYIVPEDLLLPKSVPLDLKPACKIQLPERSNVLAAAPYFNLSEPYTHQLLVSNRDHPIQLYYLQPPQTSEDDEDDNFAENAGTPSVVSKHVFPAAASFPFIKPRSEIFETATSLIWPVPGSHFIAGTRNMLAKFDVTRIGEGPILHVKTTSADDSFPSMAAGGIMGLRGTISAMGSQPGSSASYNETGLVAAGTWTRWVGLYDFASSGRCVATWGVTRAAAETRLMDLIDNEDEEFQEPDRGVGGAGITQTIWSPCGRYLLINERRSRGILVYDVRVTGKLLGWLSGREAAGNQRISCDTYPGQDSVGGFEVWSGTTDGTVKVWEGVGSREGQHQPSWDWQAHETTVSSACLHQSGSVVATASGSWGFPRLNSRDGVRSVASSYSTDSSQSSTSASSEEESPSSDSDSSSDSDENWMHRTVNESTLKLWGISSSPSQYEDEP